MVENGRIYPSLSQTSHRIVRARKRMFTGSCFSFI